MNEWMSLQKMKYKSSQVAQRNQLIQSLDRLKETRLE